MDQRQKELFSSFANELASTIRAEDLAGLLQLAKLVTSERINDIMERTESNYCRNVRLLDAVQESKSPSAFDDLIQVLERINPDSAPRLLSNNSSSPSTSSDSKKAGQSVLNRMFNRFTKSPTNQYPLGMRSSLSNNKSTTQTTFCSTSGSSGQNDANLLSPLKEIHQATLISSSSTIGISDTQSSGSHHEHRDSGFVLPRRPMNQLPTNSSSSLDPRTPPNGHLKNHRTSTVVASPNNGGDGNSRINAFSQTPTRPHDLSQINSLSLSEQRNSGAGAGGTGDDDEGNQSENSDDDEPVISWHPYAQSPTQESYYRAGSPHRCHPSYSSASSESGESSSESLIVDPNLILDSGVMTAIAREGPNMMSVKMATTCHNNHEEDYKMTARPRGKCLIVNNINFEQDIFPTRKGSDEDANRFDQIFTQLGFETMMTRNLTADQMKDKFKELAAACKPEHDALFVFILSHGSEHGIYGTDGIEVYLESEIISCFDNRNCKAMLGKPKVFVIQACRGRAKDFGGEGDTTDSIAWPSVMTTPTVATSSQGNRVPNSWLPTQAYDGKKQKKHPIRTDMLLVFSCLAGK